MFKGFDKVDTIQYIYTSIHESLCGIKLDAKNRGQYLLSGKGSVILVFSHTINSFRNVFKCLKMSWNKKAFAVSFFIIISQDICGMMEKF